MTIVKICGLSNIVHAIAAIEAGADMLGFVFAPSRRQVHPADVVTIATAVRTATLTNDRWVRLVGVFVNEAPGRMLAIAHECGLDALQLSGNEDVATMHRL